MLYYQVTEMLAIIICNAIVKTQIKDSCESKDEITKWIILKRHFSTEQVEILYVWIFQCKDYSSCTTTKGMVCIIMIHNHGLSLHNDMQCPVETHL